MKWFKFLFALYLCACLGLYLIQSKLIFAAHPTSEDQRYRMGKEIEIPLEEGLTMNTLMIPSRSGQRSKKVLMYLHGNKGNINRGIYQTRMIQNRDVDIMIIDYRGYGKTEGQPESDKQMLEDANKAYQYLKKYYQEKNIYVLGYSLGTGMASYIAKMNKPAHLILVAPFTSLTAIKNKYLWMFPDFLLRFKLNNAAHLKDLKVPTTIVHGTNDEVVEYNFSKQLKAINPRVQLITSTGQSHRGIIFDPLLSKALDSIL